MKQHTRAAWLVASVAAAAALQVGCGGSDSTAPAPAPAPTPTPVALTCDDSMKTAFRPDANTTVVAVKAFKKGDPLMLSGTATPQTAVASNDVCMVKLNVGPGNPGPAGLLSTSPGIGIEIWLPTAANWNKRVHNLGGGGFAGGVQGSPTTVANPGILGLLPSDIAGVEGAVSATTDTGHADAVHGGSFAMKPDGTINTALWMDFANRSLHETAVKSKALATAYYGSAPLFSYWEGISTGGRQGLMEAQANPADYDGILAGNPAINWTRFITAELFPQIVFQRDLGGVALTTEQQDLMSNAAIASCDVVGGQHLGYVLDPGSCQYDPTTDHGVLCVASGGTNTTAACVSMTQASAMNKIWYGQTADGSAPAPSVDNGWAQAASASLPSGNQRWFGMTRGTSTYDAALAPFVNGLASPVGPFPVAPDQVALELQDPTLSEPTFLNPTGNGQSRWKMLSYGQLSNAFDRGIALQESSGGINTDNPDLSAFKAHGGKILHWHGLADELIMPQGSVNYYNRVLAQMGGLENVQPFYRLFLVPGVGHATPNGTSNPLANAPMPEPKNLYAALQAWVEKGSAPDSLVITSPSSKPVARSQPICAYPKKATYGGSGDPNVAASFSCS